MILGTLHTVYNSIICRALGRAIGMPRLPSTIADSLLTTMTQERTATAPSEFGEPDPNAREVDVIGVEALEITRFEPAHHVFVLLVTRIECSRKKLLETDCASNVFGRAPSTKTG